MGRLDRQPEILQKYLYQSIAKARLDRMRLFCASAVDLSIS